MKYLFFISISILLISCKKEKKQVEIPFSKELIYSETFRHSSTWTSLPEDTFYTPSTECVRIENHILKLTFDQPLPNCGCAWVGAKKTISNLENLPKDKLGLRIKLNKGYFQHMIRFKNAVDPNGHPFKAGSNISESSFSFDSPYIKMTIPNSYNAWFHEDSIVSENFNKLEGIEFEIIYNQGEKILFIDGVKVDSKLAYFQNSNIAYDNNIIFKFMLGHQPEFSPRLDELYIEELEVYTWKGKFLYH